jgi:hypothetical protein
MQDLSSPALAGNSQVERYFPSTIGTLNNFLSEQAGDHMVRMFRDPYVLEPEERLALISQLRAVVSAEPSASSPRVLLGMALCVDLDVQNGLEELRQAVRLAPESFIARLKLGELLMRLRICSEAAEHTHAAAQLADNAWQAELARRQATTIRTMQREGVERGGYHKLKSVFVRTKKRFVGPAAGRSATALNSAIDA